MKLSARLDPGDLRWLISKIDGIEGVARSYATANALTKAGRDLRNDAIDRTKREFPALRASRIRRSPNPLSLLHLLFLVILPPQPASWLKYRSAGRPGA